MAYSLEERRPQLMLMLRRLAATVGAVIGGVINTVMHAPGIIGNVAPGDQAPDFTLTGSDGQTYRLNDLKGQPVVLAWFPKAFTGG
jgi:cytochrome oxidase Cu insertion factor (SCO1/SenC/PrrC family)